MRKKFFYFQSFLHILGIISSVFIKVVVKKRLFLFYESLNSWKALPQTKYELLKDPVIMVGWGFRDEEFILEHGAPFVIHSTEELVNMILGE